MSERNKPTLRIDWFDGTLIEDTDANNVQNVSSFADEDTNDNDEASRSKQFERKPIGFKKLLDLSFLNPPSLTLEVTHKSSFWLLFDTELKGDFIVLIVKILSKLYKSLEVDEKSLISNTLRLNIEKSKFMETLKNYVLSLPNIRIVQKRMNLQLWEDVELFYRNVLAICEVIIERQDYNTETVNETYKLVEMVENSVAGVKEEHSERFSSGLFEHIVEIKSKYAGDLTQKANNNQTNKGTKSKDPNNFANLKIYPTREDLLTSTPVKILPNIVDGRYPSVEQYLDIQFKLLREDCFGPLREGICKYMQNPSKRKHENIRVHTKVRIVRMYVSNNKVGHLVDIVWQQRANFGLVDSQKCATNKQLMFGSLLLFTADNFDSVLCATVLDSSLDLLRDGYVAVTFQTPVSNKIFTEPYLMVESEVFFEPYHRVLKVLQDSRLDDLPMQRYIVYVQMETKPPAYLNSETIYSIREPGREEIYFPVLDTQQWPTSASLDLDDSQMEAYKHALTKEFAVIQGPPGTGKTYLGVKIASTLLANLSLVGTPILVICYTNHALDQFLQGILKVTNNIVRLGSQSKNKALGEYTLNNLRGKVKSKYSYLYSNKRKESEKIFNEMTELQTEIEKCEEEILSYSTVKGFLKIESTVYELRKAKEDPILSWLFGHLEDALDHDDVTEDWECRLDDVCVGDKVETCFSDTWASTEIDSLNHSIKYVKDVTDDELQREAMTEKIETQIRKVRKRLICYKKYIKLQHDQNVNIPSVSDLYDLDVEQRWIVYFKAVNTIKDDLNKKMNGLVGQHNACNEELSEVATLIDGEVMKTCRVVGVTTTTAARRHDLLKKLNSTIVIVEEAAEVFEAHVVASLTHHCQHLILIGDHKQLRPTAAHYKLAKDYNLEISLFERMIRNGVHARTLTTQRRMRLKFVQLLVPAVYERLNSHPVVLDYRNVRGMANNLFFFNHDCLEDSESLDDSWSHKNTFEAKWCAELANYLRQMNYTSEDITILTTYTGQAGLIKELSKSYKSLHDVKITVVDNFQGEESRIVILSLVRSNRDGKIGFLNATNRICVALSRAKEGFYIFGNMDILKSSNETWRVINDSLTRECCIGKQLSLRCAKHNTLHTVGTSEDLGKCLKGTCLRVCEDE